MNKRQNTAIRLSAQIGRRMQEEMPDIISDVTSGQSYTKIIENRSICKMYEISLRVALQSIYNYMHGYKGGFGVESYKGMLGKDIMKKIRFKKISTNTSQMWSNPEIRKRILKELAKKRFPHLNKPEYTENPKRYWEQERFEFLEWLSENPQITREDVIHSRFGGRIYRIEYGHSLSRARYDGCLPNSKKEINQEMFERSMESLSNDIEYITDDSLNCAERMMEEEICALNKKALEYVSMTLTEREKLVVTKRFFHGKKRKSLSKVANELDITLQRVKQIEDGALAKMKKRYQRYISENDY